MSLTLQSPLSLGPFRLSHRIVMPPLTRARAKQPGDIPQALNVEYYSQRTTPGGLLITEGSQITPSGQGLPATPGIYSAEQIAGWRAVTEAVHAKGGIIFLQLWHVGRISHSSLQPGHQLPVSASAVPAAGQTYTATLERVPFETPRALDTDEIPGIVESYAQGARNALAAGFDGVEIHGANGYLLEQFLQTRTNHRSDRYGGSIENRCRLVLEVADAVVAVAGASRTGIRLSPFGIANDSGEAEPLPLYSYLIEALAKRDLAYLHLIEPRASGAGQAEVDHQGVPITSKVFRPLWPNVLIAAGNYRPDTAESAVQHGDADAIAFGRLFIANPDLPARIAQGAPLTHYDRSTFYVGGAHGYTDYPRLAE